MSAIFISYRREDSEGQAGRLFDDLIGSFGPDAVFMDVAGIDKGRDFRKIIDKHISSCKVVLVVIGKNWSDATDENGQRRLEQPSDFVRYETVAALGRDIPVIPVLIGRATMPRVDQLPSDISELAYRNAVELTHARWESDVELLIRALKPHVGVVPPSPRVSWKVLAAVFVIAAVVGAGILYGVGTKESASDLTAGQLSSAPVTSKPKTEEPAVAKDGDHLAKVDATNPASIANRQAPPTTPDPAVNVAAPASPPATAPGTTVNANTPNLAVTGSHPAPVQSTSCGSIVDNRSRLEWVVGPDRDTTWPDARKWVSSLTLCGGDWRLPSINELKTLYDPAVSAGTGFLSGNTRWPAHIPSQFDAIGGGAWVWAREAVDQNRAKAINFNQGNPVIFEKTQNQYPVRAFAVRPLASASSAN